MNPASILPYRIVVCCGGVNDPFAEWYPAHSSSGGISLVWSDVGGLERRTTPQVVREAWQKGVGDYGSPMSEPWEADFKAEPLTPVSGWSARLY